MATLLKIVVGLGILAVVWWKVVVPAGAAGSYGHVSLAPLLLCVALLAANIAAEVRVWQLLLSGAGMHIGARSALRAVLAGFSAASVSPGGVGDFAGRVLCVESGRRWLAAIALALVRIADGAIVCLVGAALAALVLPHAPGPVGAWIRTVMFIAVPLGLTFAVVYSGSARAGRFAALLRRWPSIHQAFDLAVQIPGSIRARAFGVAMLRYAVFVGQLVLALKATGSGDATLLTLTAGAGSVYLLKSVAPPITFMGLGIREAAAVGVMGALGVPAASAMAASLIVFAVNLALPAVAGLPFLLGADVRQPTPQPSEAAA